MNAIIAWCNYSVQIWGHEKVWSYSDERPVYFADNKKLSECCFSELPVFHSHLFCLCKLAVITFPPSFPYASDFHCFPAVFSSWLSSLFCDFHTPSFLFLSSCLLLLYHLHSVIMQPSASFAAWNAARHSGNLLAGWLIPVYLAPVEPAVITEPSVKDAVCRLKGQRTDSMQVLRRCRVIVPLSGGWLSMRGDTGRDSRCWGFQSNVLKVVVAFCIVFKTMNQIHNFIFFFFLKKRSY